jgi:hypothetical protein
MDVRRGNSHDSANHTGTDDPRTTDAGDAGTDRLSESAINASSRDSLAYAFPVGARVRMKMTNTLPKPLSATGAVCAWGILPVEFTQWT